MIHCCKHCGALLEDETQVCDFCGAVLEAPKDAEPAPQEVVAPQEITEKNTATPVKKKLSKKSIFFLAGGIVLAIIAVISAVALFANTSNSAITTYEAVMNGDVDRLVDLAPMEYWEAIANSENTTVDAYIAEKATRLKNRYLSSTTEEYSPLGKLLSIEMQVLDREPVNNAILSALKNNLERRYEIDSQRIGSAYHLFVKTTREFTQDTRYFADIITVIEIDSQWYMIRYEKYTSDEYMVAFLAGAL